MAEIPSPSEIEYQLAHADDDKRPPLIIASTICLSAAFVAVLLRLVSRRLNHLSLKADDYMMLVALFLAASFVASILVCLHYGFGRHAVLLRDPVAFAKTVLAAESIYVPASTPIKLSLLLLYHRLFVNRRLTIVCWCITVYLVVVTVIAVLVAVFKCLPVRGLWDPTVDARCINFRVWIQIHGGQNVVTDFLILLLPAPQVWKLKMARWRKVQVTGIFLLGGFASIASIIRLPYLRSHKLVDASWSMVDGAMWSIVEINMGVVAANLPTFGPLLAYIRHGRSGSHRPKGPSTSDSTLRDYVRHSPAEAGAHKTRQFMLLDSSQEGFESNAMTTRKLGQDYLGSSGEVETGCMPSDDRSGESWPVGSIRVTTDLDQDHQVP